MKKFYIRVGLIILIHIIWFFFPIMLAAYNDSSEDIIQAWSFFLIEPIFLFVIYPLIVYGLIFLMLRIKPICTHKQNKILTIIGVVCTVMVIGYPLLSYVMIMIEDGFSLFLHDDYWLGILF